MKGWIYVAADGNYGSAEDLILLEESFINSQEWEEIEDVSDLARVAYAEELSKRIAERRIQARKDRRY